MQSLFPTQAARGAQGSSILQIPAGKCLLTQLPTARYQVTADMRRGQIQLTKGADGILHFKWVNLSNGAVEDDRMVFGGDCKFKKVKTGRENDSKDRVYMLKFNVDRKPLMFWMQSPDTSKDEELVKKLSGMLENPSTAVAGVAVNDGLGGLGGLGGMAGLSGLGGAAAGGNAANFAGLPPNLMQLLGQRGALPGTAPTATATTAAVPSSSATGAVGGMGMGMGGAAGTLGATGAAPFGNLDLSSLLGGMAAPRHTATQPAIHQQQQQQQHHQQQQQQLPATPALQDIFTGEDIARSGILSDPAVQSQLVPHLPETQQSETHLRHTTRTAQMQQSLGSLTAALRNPDNFQSVMSNFNLSAADGHDQIVRGDGVGAFLTAIQAAADRETAADAAAANAGGAAAADNAEEKKDDQQMDET